MKITKEVRNFLIVGILTILIDYLVYSFSRKLNIYTPQAKVFGFISGTIFAFFANRNITFKNHNNKWEQLIKFFILYCATLIINILINDKFLYYLFEYHYKFQFSFIVATTSSAIINFVGMKYFIFIKKFK